MIDNVEAVLFDFDGVLVDSEPIHFAAWKEALEPHGVQLSEQVFLDRFVGLEDREAIRLVAEEQVPPRNFEDLWAAYAVKQRIFGARIAASPLVPMGSRELIAHLKSAGYRVAVVTSSSRNEVEPILVSCGIRSLFDVGVFAEDVSRKKPDPEPYLTAKRLLNVSRTIALEDSNAGQTSARAAGCEVIPVTDVMMVATQVRERLGLELRRTDS